VTSKVRFKLGQLEVECEGTEDFLRDELPKLLETFSRLQRTIPAVERQPDGSNGTNGATIQPPATATAGSVSFYAKRLGCKTAADLTKAAMLHMFHTGKHSFNRKDILDAMKSAKSFFKRSMENNFNNTVETLAKEGIVNNVGKNEWALKDDARDELELKLAATPS
jgi:hypothetical protein